MMCPVCDKGVIIKIRFRRTKELAAVCDLCDALWFEPEHIHAETAHTFRTFTREEEFEYVGDDPPKKDRKYQSGTLSDV